jgi:hypothetical protein
VTELEALDYFVLSRLEQNRLPLPFAGRDRSYRPFARRRRLPPRTKNWPSSLDALEAMRLFDAEGLVLEDLTLRRSSLDDVFLALTGQTVEPIKDSNHRPVDSTTRTAQGCQ